MMRVPTYDRVDYDTQRLPYEQEWFLLREDVEIAGHVYRAGTPVMKANNSWYVCGVDDPIPCSLDGRLCRTEYGGLSLHVVSRASDGGVSHRRVGSDDPAETIPVSRVLSPPDHGHDKVYLAFGDQFYPLEYFGW